MTVHTSVRQWPAEGLTRVPYWVYSDHDLYAQEQERIFRGDTWSFLCLEAELPKPEHVPHLQPRRHAGRRDARCRRQAARVREPLRASRRAAVHQ